MQPDHLWKLFIAYHPGKRNHFGSASLLEVTKFSIRAQQPHLQQIYTY